MIHLVLASTPWARGFDFNLLTLDLCLVEMLHGLLCVPYVIELDEFVVFLVGCFSYLFDLPILTERGLQFFICGRWVQIEYNQGALVLVFLGRVVLRDGVMDVELAAANELPLEVAHGIFCVADVVIRNHHEPAVLALCVHGADGPISLEEHVELLVFHIRVDVAHKQRARRMFAVGMFAKGCDIWHSIQISQLSLRG